MKGNIMFDLNYHKTLLHGLEIEMSLGIVDWERVAGKKQRIVIDVDLYRWQGPFTGKTINDCMDYARVFSFVTQNWPDRAHVDLIETLAEELIGFCLQDVTVEACRVAIRKPHVFNGKAVPGVEFFRKKS